jgi:hypothetical protein
MVVVTSISETVLQIDEGVGCGVKVIRDVVQNLGKHLDLIGRYRSREASDFCVKGVVAEAVVLTADTWNGAIHRTTERVSGEADLRSGVENVVVSSYGADCVEGSIGRVFENHSIKQADDRLVAASKEPRIPYR